MPWTRYDDVSNHFYEFTNHAVPSEGQQAFLNSETWSTLVHAMHNFLADAIPFEPKYLFRGQANAAWTLKPSLLRCIGPGAAPTDVAAEERRLLREFDRQRQLYWSSERPRSDRESWALMQHHGIPTRLLDWTASLWVALYFAVEGNLDQDGALFIVNARELQDAAKRKLGKSDGAELLHALDEALTNGDADPLLLYPFPAEQSSERGAAQQGYFTLCTDIRADHYDVINDQCGATRVPIPAQVKPHFLNELRMMGVAGQSLFPGPDGFGRSLREAAAIRAFMHRRESEEEVRISVPDPIGDWPSQVGTWAALDEQRDRAEHEQAQFILSLVTQGVTPGEIAKKLRLPPSRVRRLMEYGLATPFDVEGRVEKRSLRLFVRSEGKLIEADTGGQIIAVPGDDEISRETTAG